jgi:hypothetical protein
LCFSTKPAALRRKSKDWSTRNQDNVSEWGDMKAMQKNGVSVYFQGIPFLN